MNNTASATELDPIVAAWVFLGIFAVLTVIAIVAAARAERTTKYKRARAAHPAGKGRIAFSPSVEPIRHAWRR